MVLIALVVFSLTALVADAAYARPRPPLVGIAIPLAKRYSLYGRAGITDLPVADIPGIERHVDSINAKYQQGMHNWQVNTGELDLWPVPNATDTASPEATPQNGLLDYLLAAQPNALSNHTHSVKIFNASATPKIFHTADIHNTIPIETAASAAEAAPTAMNDFGRRSGKPATQKHRVRQSEPLKDVSNDLLWVGEVKIGSNGQTFVVDMDT